VFARRDGAGNTHTLLADALGSTVRLEDPGGTLPTEYSYEPFGATTASGASSVNGAQFTSRENDGTGLYHYRARYYNPMIQRFVSEDPIGFSGGDVNVHAYTFNSPTNLTDPTGELTLYVPPGVLAWLAPSCAELHGRARSGKATRWDRFWCDLELGSALPTPIAMAGAAKSAAELAKHVDQLSKARQRLKELERLLEHAKRRNTRERLATEIQDLLDWIAGHVKEMGQKWPGYKP
jgi:RHS repeat-associated protein